MPHRGQPARRRQRRPAPPLASSWSAQRQLLSSEVELFRRLADADKLADCLSIGKFVSEKHAATAADLIKRTDGLMAAVPIVVNLAKSYMEERETEKREALNYGRVQQLRDQLDAVANQIAQPVVAGNGEDGWEQEVQFLLGRLVRLRPVALISHLEEQLQ